MKNLIREMKPIQALKLTGDISKNWQDFVARFKILMATHEFQKKTDSDKLSAFLDCIGKEGYEIFETFNIPAKELAGGCIVNKLIEVLEKYFMAFKTVSLYNTCRFFTRVQKKKEPFDSYLNEIEEIAKWCQFGPLTNKMIRDRLISGVNDLNLQYKFKTMDNPSLEEVIGNCRELERAKEKLNSIYGEKNFFFSDNNKLNDMKSSVESESFNGSSLTLETSSSSEDDESSEMDSEIEENHEPKRRKVEISSSTDSGLDLKDEKKEKVQGVPNKRFHCNNCDKSYVTKIDLRTHVMRCMKISDEDLQDGKPGKETPEDDAETPSESTDNSLHHNNSKSNAESSDSKPRNKFKTKTPDGRYGCDDCDVSYQHMQSLNRHFANCHKDKYQSKISMYLNKKTGRLQCDDCGMSYAHYTNLYRHKKSCHTMNNSESTNNLNQSRKLICNDCGISYTHVSSLRRHAARCDIRLAKENPDSVNAKQEAPKEKFPCDDCGKSFAYRRSLKRHKDETCAGKNYLISALLKDAEEAMSDKE